VDLAVAILGAVPKQWPELVQDQAFLRQVQALVPPLSRVRAFFCTVMTCSLRSLQVADTLLLA